MVLKIQSKRSNNIFKRKDKVGILFFSILSIIGFVYYIVMDIKSCHVDANLISYYKEYLYAGIRIYMIIFFIWWIGILGLIYYSFKGVWRNYKWKNKRPLLFVLFIIFIIYGFLNYPLYTLAFSSSVWIVIESLAVFFVLLFLKESMG
ncbi:MAG: hypothetical protein GY756_02910 [bacterium]|nr:hypothetical protein [bacterium]